MNSQAASLQSTMAFFRVTGAGVAKSAVPAGARKPGGTRATLQKSREAPTGMVQFHSRGIGNALEAPLDESHFTEFK
jgi:hypothetical protein